MNKLEFKQELRTFARFYLLDPYDHWDLETHWCRYEQNPKEYDYLFPKLRKENLIYAAKVEAFYEAKQRAFEESQKLKTKEDENV